MFNPKWSTPKVSVNVKLSPVSIEPQTVSSINACTTRNNRGAFSTNAAVQGLSGFSEWASIPAKSKFCTPSRGSVKSAVVGKRKNRRSQSAIKGQSWKKQGYASPIKFNMNDDPYRIHQVNRKLESIKIEQKCQKSNRESICAFYSGMIRRGSTGNASVRQKTVSIKSPKKSIALQPEEALPTFEEAEATIVTSQQQPVETPVKRVPESMEQLQLEEIRDTRLNFNNFLMTNRKSYITLKEVRCNQYSKPFESKNPFLSLNRKLLGKASKFSRLKTYTIITTYH